MIARLIDWSARNLMLVFIGAIFAIAAGVYALQHSALDAIPDLSDTQVIVYTEYKGQAPQVIEDQVTYPLTTAMLTVPKSKVVRGFSFFGVSFVYIIFEDGTDIYWARSRVLEYLNAAAPDLHRPRFETALALVEQHKLPLAAVDHRAAGYGYDWSFRPRGNFDVGIHVRPQHVVRVG